MKRSKNSLVLIFFTILFTTGILLSGLEPIVVLAEDPAVVKIEDPGEPQNGENVVDLDELQEKDKNVDEAASGQAQAPATGDNGESDIENLDTENPVSDSEGGAVPPKTDKGDGESTDDTSEPNPDSSDPTPIIPSDDESPEPDREQVESKDTEEPIDDIYPTQVGDFSIVATLNPEMLEEDARRINIHGELAVDGNFETAVLGQLSSEMRLNAISPELDDSSEQEVEPEIYIFDLSLDDGAQTTDIITITIQSKELKGKEQCQVFHQLENGIENIPVAEDNYDPENGILSFQTSSFSLFAVVLRGSETTEAIYLGGANADDNNSGIKAEEPVASLEKAVKLANGNSATTIYVLGEVNLTNDYDLTGTNLVIKRYPEYKGYLFSVNNNGSTVSLSNITIDGNAAEVKADKSLISVTSGATLTLGEGIKLENNDISYIKEEDGNQYSDGHGGAIFVSGATLNMNEGCTITKNVARLGGGVYLTEGASFNLSGGLITQNTLIMEDEAKYFAYSDRAARGGGALVGKNATMTFSGGSISGNTGAAYGGGIAIGEAVFGIYISDDYGGTLDMTGGSIESNIANNYGGGIFINPGPDKDSAGVATITAGRIIGNQVIDNTTLCNGGGIYVEGYAIDGSSALQWSGYPGTLNIYNALISNNSAGTYGGGYAAYFFSETNIFSNHGATILSNSADLGKDVAVLGRDNPKGVGRDYGWKYYHDFSVSDYLLENIPYFWNDDDGSLVSSDALEGKNAQQSLLLTAGINPENYLDQGSYSVFIQDNSTPTEGGGIGSHGKVNIGNAPYGPDSLQTTSRYKITIDDKDSLIDNLPEKIDVAIYAASDDHAFEKQAVTSARLSRDNGYEMLLDLPAQFTYTASANGGESECDREEYEVPSEADYIFRIQLTNDDINDINENNAKQIHIRASVEWDDASYQDDLPNYYKHLTLCLNGVDKTESGANELSILKLITVDKNSDWKCDFGYFSRDAHYGYVVALIDDLWEPTQCKIKEVENGEFIIYIFHEPEKTNINVEVNWSNADLFDVALPSTITLDLYDEEGLTDAESLELSKENNWMGSFNEQLVYKDGYLIEYNVKISRVCIGDTEGELATWEELLPIRRKKPDSPDDFIIYYRRPIDNVIYCDGLYGDDTADGLSVDTAVASLGRVNDLLRKNPDIDTRL